MKRSDMGGGAANHTKAHRSATDASFDNKQGDRDLKFTEVDREAYAASFSLVANSPILRSIVQYFSSSCMSNEVSLHSKDGKEIPISAELRDMVASHFIPVCMRAIRWILVLGLVPVSFEDITRRICIPVIPDAESVNVSCARNVPGYRTIYRVTEEGDGGGDDGSDGYRKCSTYRTAKSCAIQKQREHHRQRQFAGQTLT